MFRFLFLAASSGKHIISCHFPAAHQILLWITFLSGSLFSRLSPSAMSLMIMAASLSRENPLWFLYVTQSFHFRVSTNRMSVAWYLILHGAHGHVYCPYLGHRLTWQTGQITEMSAWTFTGYAKSNLCPRRRQVANFLGFPLCAGRVICKWVGNFLFLPGYERFSNPSARNLNFVVFPPIWFLSR